jgi:ketosteroid isomerase-like protein
MSLLGATAAPAFAQQGLRQAIDAVFSDWLDAVNRGDGNAATALFLPSAPTINPNGIARVTGQEYANRIELQHRQNARTTARIDEVHAIGSDGAYAFGPWTTTFGANGESEAHGMWLQLYQRQGLVWKIGASSFTRVGGGTTRQ